jgi:cytochrome P450
MSHSFSISYVKEMEQYLDANIKILRGKISEFASTNQTFDLKKALHYYVIDTLGELAFSQTFCIQVSNDESRVPPVIEHSLLAAVTGAWPMMTARLKRWLPLVPHKGLNALFEGRKACADLASRCVNVRLNVLRNSSDSKTSGPERKDILTNLINVKHPDTGKHLTQTDLETEAFGFMCAPPQVPHFETCRPKRLTLLSNSIAGTHTTSATTTLLFHHLLHHPDVMAKCVAEIDTNLPPLQKEESAYAVTAAESSLPYLRNCMKENFRVTPVFTMPLARRVMKPEGVVIAGNHIPYGVSATQPIQSQVLIRSIKTSIAVCNHAFHHNPEVFGVDHNIFNPARWDDPEIANKSKLLMHFGLGGRQCIGKTVAMTNIYKLMSTLLSEFEFELADEKERGSSTIEGASTDIPELISVGISDLASPLMVKASKRKRVIP